MFNLPKIAVTLNITPDSFSDGGRFLSLEKATEALAGFLEAGADIIDIGGESTRPNLCANENKHHGPISTIGHEIEWERISKVVAQAVEMVAGTNTKISVDSRNYETFKKALDLGINIINDVSGLYDKRLIGLLKEYSCQIITMHNLGVPADPQVLIDQSEDATDFIASKLAIIRDSLLESGVRHDQIILDPGIGFGNDASQAAQVLNNIHKIQDLGCAVMVGHSRKSFFNQITDLPYSQRDLETHIISVYLALKKVNIIRVHDLLGTKRALAAAGLVNWI